MASRVSSGADESRRSAASPGARRTPRGVAPARLRSLLSHLTRTPLHPQWLVFLPERRNLEKTCRALCGTVLDIGCADRKARRYLPDGSRYVGLDHHATAQGWYGTRPDVYGDAVALPLADRSIDHVLLLDVLEHVPEPDRCLGEIARVLRGGGTLTIQVPFLYPVHDAPLDFHRWTGFGLARAAEKHGFEVTEEEPIGHPLESAALNANIAMSRSVLEWVRGRSPLALGILILPLLVPVLNVLAWILGRMSRMDDLMPHSHRMVWRKR